MKTSVAASLWLLFTFRLYFYRSFFFKNKIYQKRAHANYHWHRVPSCVASFVLVRRHAYVGNTEKQKDFSQFESYMYYYLLCAA